MSKIKINLASGNVVEKPLVTCFKGTNGSYIVFDNETNGSMGLPIICISKFNGTTAEKIFDQSEWGSVKENLKTIIAGTALPYLSVPETITAQDDFFTQLTLPVASFDLLKNVYSPAAETPTPVTDNIAPVAQIPAEPVTPVVPEPAPIVSSEVLAPAPVIEPTPVASAPVIDAPIINPAVENAPVSSPVVQEESVAPVIAAPTVAPVSAPTENVVQNHDTQISNQDIVAIKENFMKSCENMFDALIKKFENK